MGPTFLGAPDSWQENPPFGRVTERSGWYDETGAGGWHPTTELPSRARLTGGTQLVVYRRPLPCSRAPLPESTLMTIERPRRIAIRLLPHPPWWSKRQPGKRPESRRRLAEHPRPGVTDCGVPFPTPPDSGHILFVEYQWEPSRGSRARKRRLSGAVAARRVLSARQDPLMYLPVPLRDGTDTPRL